MQEANEKSETNAAPAPAPAPAPVPVAVSPVAQKSSSGIFTLLLDMLLIMVISTLAAFAMLAFGPKYIPALRQTQEQQLVTVDLDLLAREQMRALAQRVRDGAMDAKDMPKQTAVFAQALVERVQGYAKEGKVVMRSDALVAVPESVHDLTDSIRSDLVKAGSMYQPTKREDAK